MQVSITEIKTRGSAVGPCWAVALIGAIDQMLWNRSKPKKELIGINRTNRIAKLHHSTCQAAVRDHVIEHSDRVIEHCDRVIEHCDRARLGDGSDFVK